MRRVEILHRGNPLTCARQSAILFPGDGQQMHFERLKRRELITLLGGATAAVARSAQPVQSNRWVARRLAMFGVRRCDYRKK
jgi:hypothetical protein